MKLTIITINYNNASGLQKTMQSVVSQSFTDFEYLVIDGGSTDGSVALISKYATPLNLPQGDTKERFNWVTEPDEGVYSAMNKGIRMAKGEYCLFLNSGDYLSNEMVLSTVFSNEPTADIVIGNELRGAGRVKAPIKISFFDLYTSSLPHQSTFVKRKLFEEVGVYNEELRIVSDWEFWIKAIVIHNCSVAKLEIDITVYDITGISNTNIEQRTQERELVLTTLFPERVLEDYQTFEKYSQVLAYLKLINDNKMLRNVLKFSLSVFKKVGTIYKSIKK